MIRFEFTQDADDVGNTIVENAFINHFMPRARGDYVKIYLYGLKNCCYSKKHISLENSDISENLGIALADVEKAWQFWENEGVVEIELEDDSETIVRFKSISAQLFFGGIEPGSLKKQKKVKSKKLFEKIEQLLSRPLTVTETDMLYCWKDEYNFTSEAIGMIIEDCILRGKNSPQYWNGMAVHMADEGIRTLNDVKSYFSERDNSNRRYKEIMNYMGKYGNPTQPEKKIIDKWFDDYGFDSEKIKTACDETIKAANPSFKYVDTILSAWHEGKDIEISAFTSKQGSKKSVHMENDHNYSPEEIEDAIFGRDIVKEMKE